MASGVAMRAVSVSVTMTPPSSPDFVNLNSPKKILLS